MVEASRRIGVFENNLFYVGYRHGQKKSKYGGRTDRRKDPLIQTHLKTSENL